MKNYKGENNMRASDCPCLGCTPETGRHSECHSSCAGYKSFLDKYKKEKKKEKEMNMSYYSEEKAKNERMWKNV